MRVLCLLAVVVASSSVNLAHVPDFAVKDRSPFASAVLAELDSHLAAGGPADELQRIVDDIRKRVTDAGTADSDGWKDRSTTCEVEQKKLQTLIDVENDKLTANLAKQGKERGIISEATANEGKYTSERDGFQGEIEQLDLDLKEAARKRAFEKEVFENRTKDTGECIDAITEILALDGNKILDKNQGITADTIKEGYKYEKGSTDWNSIAISNQTLLASLQSKVTSRGAKALLADSLDSGANYDDLEELLNRLNVELEKYSKELARVESEAITQYDKTKKNMEKERATKVTQKETAEKNRADAEQTRIAAEGRLAAAEQEETKIRGEIKSLGDAKNTWKTTCDIQKTEYDARVVDRAEEIATLNAIEKILQEKLGHLMEGADATSSQSDVRTRVDGVTSD